jgi:subtilisin family serine protease
MLKRFAIIALVVAVIASAFLPIIASAQTPPPPMSSIIVKMVAGLTPAQQADVIARNGGIELSQIPAFRLHVIAVPTSDLAATLAAYQGDPQVQRAEENKVRQTETAPNDPLYPSQWYLPQINWDLAFGTVTPTGSSIVAILDTGVDATHPDLGSNVVAGTSMLDGSNGMTDSNGHGTSMAGIVAGQTNTITPEGMAGVAYAGVRTMPVTVLDANGLGQDSDVIAGVIWAADNGANVILMGFSRSVTAVFISSITR